jgi:hypothetical protein
MKLTPDTVHPAARKTAVLLALPWLLLFSTALVFICLARWLGRDGGYVLGFVFYWAVWCYAVPCIMLGPTGVLSSF